MKINLNNVGSLINATTAENSINNNNDTIEEAFENTLSRDGTTPNTMEAPLDMNSQQVLNLPNPATVNSPLRLQDLSDFVGGGTVSSIPPGGTTGQVLAKDSNISYDIDWTNSVTSVGLTLPSDFSISNSPVTTIGTLTGTWAQTPTGTGKMVRDTDPTFSNNLLVSGGIASTTYNNVGITPPASTANLILGAGVFATLPSTDTYVGRATTDTLTNKTLTNPTINGTVGGTSTAAGLTAGNVTTNANLTGHVTSVGNVTSLGSFTSANLKAAITDETGSGAAVFATSPALVTPTGIVKADVGLGNVDNTSDATKNAAAVTLTNKTITAPVISTISNTGTLTLPTSTDTLVGRATTDTLTNKTLTNPNIVGTTTNNNAAAGSVGEYVEAIVLLGSAVSLTTATPANITSISLTAGDWDVSAVGYFNPGGTTNVVLAEISINTTSATRNTATMGAFNQLAYGAGITIGGSGVISEGIPCFRISIASTTTVYFVAYSTFSVSTNSAYGKIHARRVR